MALINANKNNNK